MIKERKFMIHLTKDLERLKKEILLLGSMVEESINKAIIAAVQRRPELCKEVIDGDQDIDEKEVQVEDICLKILALHQPVARDLRFIVSVLKMNSYLERMGDLAQNIAERAYYLGTHEELELPDNFDEMAETVKRMVRESLDSLVNADAEMARKIADIDDKVDEINESIFALMQDKMMEDGRLIKRAQNIISISYQLERIADLANNISEDVIFMVEGEIVRHYNKLED
jgi:phosphate transport system protein